MTASDIAETLSIGRYRLGHEALLQDDVEAHLRRAGVSFRREFVLGPAERVDFLIEGHIALELKIRCSKRMTFRQLERYAKHDRVTSIVLATASAISLPREIAGKATLVVPLGLTGL